MADTNNFIEEIVSEELAEGKVSSIYTRFPPEPNGYLHIGHAKSLCINFGIKEKYNGKCNLRYDDTNPVKEDLEYVDSIKEDIKWLGFSWDKELYASDYFDRLYDCAVSLIKKGLAFVCDMTPDEIRESRGTLTEPGKNSPYRERSIEENLMLFENMKNGMYPDGSKVLRAKIDMASPNINMRDPIMYRIMRATHHRTGDKWCIYPMYDFAHPLSDAFEGITHSICTLEFEDHRPLYDWFKLNCGFGANPRQIEFARLNITRTIMSKRYLKSLVEKGVVDGWSDPRMPTLSGMRERGYPPEAIKEFCNLIGVSKANSEVNVAMLEHCVRDNLNQNAMRVMAVTNPLKLIVDNYPDGESENLVIENNPNDESAGSREVTFSRELYIEKEDFSINPPPKYHRLKISGMVRLKGAYILEYSSHETDSNGNVTAVHCNFIEKSKSGEENAAIKVKGVIHWVDANNCVPITLNKYDYLLTEEGEGLDFNERLNPNSLVVLNGYGEKCLGDSKPYTRYQFMRDGYYMTSSKSTSNNKIFNFITGLKDSFKM